MLSGKISDGRKGLPRLDIMELAANAFRYVRDGFRKYHKERREQGLKRARAKRESVLSRKEIEAKVKREVSLEIAAGRFPCRYGRCTQGNSPTNDRTNYPVSG